MTQLLPKEVFFTRGLGVHKEKLASFELALRDAGIHRFNLVKVSSIFPPGCRIIDREEGLKKLQSGEVIFAVLSENSSNEPRRKVGAGVGVAIPRDKTLFGYISEHHSFGMSQEELGDYVEDLAAYMLASTLGIADPSEVEWDENKDVWKLNEKIVYTKNTSIVAEVPPRGLWTTVIAAAVFIMGD
ncbi:MAG: arginine decarboxylase, pyruvoyl-dependent [Thermoplasmata archaeon]|nr:arginine decarboxylase, pyruvoyl-dependent [Thermoplasmata archaeon]